MKTTARIIPWVAAVLGSGLLFWKGFPGLIFFLYNVVATPVTNEPPASPVLPGFLLAASGFGMLAFVQVFAIWRAASRKKIFSVLRSAFALLGGILLVKAISLTIGAFQVLGVSGGSDPSKLHDALSEAAIFCHGGILMLCLSAIAAAAGIGKETSAGGRRRLRLPESIGWGISAILLFGLAFFHARLDTIGRNSDAAGMGPAELAQLISNILIGESLWSFTLIGLAIVGMISTAIVKPPPLPAD